MTFRATLDGEGFVKLFDDRDDVWGEIDGWCNENCEGDWSYLHGLTWKFELESDAMAFVMVWA